MTLMGHMLGMLGAIVVSVHPCVALIDGYVTVNARPLPGVAIVVSARGVSKAWPHSTDANGGFRIDPAALFDPSALDTENLIVTLKKQGFYDETRHIKAFPRGQWQERLQVVMTPEAGAARLTPDEHNALLDSKSSDGLTLYLFPYTFVGTSPPHTLASDKINTQFRQYLERAINTRLQALAPVSARQISLRPLATSILSTDNERVLAYGAFLNALAMINGQGSIQQQHPASQVVKLSSRYTTIPWLPTLRAAIQHIDDTIALEQFQAAKLSQSVSEQWGHSTVLALGMQEFQQAEAVDRSALERIRAYLRAELNNTAAEQKESSAPVQVLFDLVDKALDAIEDTHFTAQ